MGNEFMLFDHRAWNIGNAVEIRIDANVNASAEIAGYDRFCIENNRQ
jgi:flagellar basal body L-ring protein FlgH